MMDIEDLRKIKIPSASPYSLLKKGSNRDFVILSN
jgi:hypothetical protein